MRHLSQFVFLLSILFAGCRQEIGGTRLEQALAFAGENRLELEKVLDRYASDSSDSLKYRAACFLIENMPGYHYYEGEELDKHAIYFDALGKSKKQPAPILDSLYNIFGRFNPNSLVQKQDIHEIDSAFLCENIDHAFMVWEKYPWNRNTLFDDFCENILPYRIKDERLTNWRKMYYDLFSPYLEGLATDDPVEAAKHLREAILKERGKPRFTMMRPSGYPNLDARNALYFNGSCDDLAQFTLFAFRSVGIPCTIDFISICGNYNLGHSWVVFRNNKGDYYAMDFFDNIEYVSDKSRANVLRKHKAYRKTFSFNARAIRKMKKVEKDAPPFFSSRYYRFRDVTMLYSNNYLQTVRIPSELLYHRPPKNKIIYLCGSSWQKWEPLDWAIPDKKGEVVFRDQNIGDIVRLAVYNEGNFTFLTDPFKIDEQDHSIKTYSVSYDANPGSMTLFSKYPIEGDLVFRNRMLGGVFEGSNDPSFHRSDTLHVIEDVPSRLFTIPVISTGKQYQYARYKGPAGGYCNVAEVRFMSDTACLTGKVMGTPGVPNHAGTHECANVFDGFTETSFHYDDPDGGWVGLDFGVPQKITSIAYTPRNHDNFVEEGQRYELFVSGRSGWESLGLQVASSDSLRYDNVPMGGLYYLKNHSSGKEERIFLMEDGEQVFK